MGESLAHERMPPRDAIFSSLLAVGLGSASPSVPKNVLSRSTLVGVGLELRVTASSLLSPNLSILLRREHFETLQQPARESGA